VEPFVLPLRPFLVFLVVLARVGGLVSFAPFWAHRAVSPPARIVLAVIIAIALTPIVMTKIQTPPSEVSDLVVVLTGEIVIGMLFGFVGRVAFTSFEYASHFLSSQMGFSLAGTIDPSTQAQTTAFGTVAQMLALVTLLSVNGHHWFVAATVKSFSTTSPGNFAMNAQLLDQVIRLSANALSVGVSIAAPAIIVLLAVEFALEFFGRTAPQFQVFILGLPIKIIVGFWLLGVSIYFLSGVFRDVMGGVEQSLSAVLTNL